METATFRETFALADDRGAVLEQLIPGTEDYYYFNCLHRQHQGELARIDDLLDPWLERHGETARYKAIVHRQALLTYADDPARTRDYLRDELDPELDHQRRVEEEETQYPSALDPELLDRQRLTERALAEHRDLSGFTTAASEWLLERKELDGERRRALLQRLERPDHDNLVELIAADLAYKRSGGFGSLNIHRQLLPPQLEALAEKRPELWKTGHFVETLLAKRQPNPDVDWENDPAERLAHLEGLWATVAGLAPSFNSLKAHVLYHRLDHDRRGGTYDRERFLAYLALPRRAGYVEPTYIKEGRDLADLRADFRRVTLLPQVGDDEALISDYLAHFFVVEESMSDFAVYLRDAFLKRIFATTKLLHGIGNAESWYSMLDDPGAYRALKERVDIELTIDNPEIFRPDQPVALNVDVKNVETLVVKVFEINTINFYRTQNREIDTGLDLDGLVASEEHTFTYDEPPIRRVRRELSLPSLTGAGVWVVELIGNGRSSRALIRKGTLRYLSRFGAAGHVLTVLDADNRVLTDASVWLGGREHEADDEGQIRIPFTTRPGRKDLLLCHAGFAVLDSFYHLDESYGFQADFYVDRESLLARREAQVVLRAHLSLHNVPVSLKLLEEARLVIDSTDRHGVSASREIGDLELRPDRETVVDFKVPDNLAQISFNLRARVKNVSRGGVSELSARRGFALNGIDQSDAVEDLHLQHNRAGHLLLLLGKSGEARARAIVNLELHHRDFTRTIEATLQTDDQGRIQLGALEGIELISATTNSGIREAWPLRQNRCHYPAAIHAAAKEPIELPYVGSAERPERWALALLEVRGGTFVADRFSALELEHGRLRIEALPAGDYTLTLKELNRSVALKVSAGQPVRDWLVSPGRRLQCEAKKPLQIRTIDVDDELIEITLGHTSEQTRVHLFATQLAPAHDLFGLLGGVRRPALARDRVSPAFSRYLSGRDIGDEYRYILERKYAAKFPGNLLTRPGLLVNPWPVRESSTDQEELAAAESLQSSREMARPAAAPPPAPQPSTSLDTSQFASLDFLAEPARLLTNLRPNAEGRVEIERRSLANATHIRILALDQADAVTRELCLPPTELAVRDLRLVDGLDPKGHYTETKQRETLDAGGTITLDDITTAEMERYPDLHSALSLLLTLSGNEGLAKLAFLANWPDLDAKTRRERYDEHACHELHLFLARKDPDFFREVIAPHLRNKPQKTFIDRYLLDEDLSRYLEPWAHGQLNLVEQILLAGRLGGDEPGKMTRRLDDRLAVEPPDLEADDHLFNAALGSQSLEEDDGIGFFAAKEKATKAKRSAKRAPMAGKKMAMEMNLGGGSGAPGGLAMAAVMDMPAEMAGEEEEDWDEGDAFAMDDEPEPDPAMRGDLEDAFGGDDDLRARGADLKPLFRQQDQTKEWAESNYYRLTIGQQGPELIRPNRFWRDFAAHDGSGPFLSAELVRATGSLTEMLLALAVIDLPFSAPTPEVSQDGLAMTLRTATPMIAFHKAILPSATASGETPILVSQSYVRADDRHRWEDGEQVDKYVTGEMLTHVVYVCQVVLTNPTSTPQKVDLLLQIPSGAIPVANGFVTKGQPLRLEPHDTESIELAFYFPSPGEYGHFPVHVAQRAKLIASCEPTTLTVVRRPSQVDAESWAWVSQHGEADQVLRYLREENLEPVELEAIAWRLRDREFFDDALATLEARHLYDHDLWAYALAHEAPAHLRTYLAHCEDFLGECGAWLDCELVRIEPFERRLYEHLEYAPLINARAHKLGRERKILNRRFNEQWQRLLDILCHQPRLAAADWLAVATYLLLQDRVADGRDALARVERDQTCAKMQHDYLRAFLAFSTGEPTTARELAERWVDYPVDRWRNLFANVLAQVAEVEGAEPATVDEEDLSQRQAQLAASEPAIDLEVGRNELILTYQNLASCQVSYYGMDIELLFSRQPFVQQQSDQFSFIKPNRSDTIALPAGENRLVLPLPEELRSANVIVEVNAAGLHRVVPSYAHELSLQLSEAYGQLRVTHRDGGNPLPEVYVKAYARTRGGETRFFKDGYTDLRGKFDYVSLSTDDLDRVERFALLILSEQHGAVIREVDPPQR